MQIRFLLNVIISQSTSIFQLLMNKNQPLLVRRDALLILNLSLHIINGVQFFLFNKFYRLKKTILIRYNKSFDNRINTSYIFLNFIVKYTSLQNRFMLTKNLIIFFIYLFYYCNTFTSYLFNINLFIYIILNNIYLFN